MSYKTKLMLSLISKKDIVTFRENVPEFEAFKARFRELFKPYQMMVKITDDDLKEIYTKLTEEK